MAGDLLRISRPARDSADAAPVSYRIETWGCQMNEHDSERMAGALSARGLSAAAGAAEADVIVLNTCAVREKATEKVFSRLGRLRRLKRHRPDLIIGVAGCVAQLEQAEIFRRAPFVDFVMGPRQVGELPRLVEEARRRRRAIAVFDPRDRLLPEAAPIAPGAGRVKTYVTVMEGCNMPCTFCIVPVTRGREACRPAASILEEARRAADRGCLEVELLGQTVNAWRAPGWDFPRLLGAVAEVPGLRRVRFTTSHPMHFKTGIADLLAAPGVLCPHVHLPVQSGSDAVLAAMRRGYTRDEYLARIDGARSRRPDLALSTDVIVGFPGETEADFGMTLDLVRHVRFHQVYAFVFSPRPGTPAASMPDDVPAEQKRERLRRLLDVQDEIVREIHAAYVGRVEEVLVEGPSATDPARLTGRTPCARIVNFEGPASLVGMIARVRILRAAGHSLVGETIRAGSPAFP